MDFPDKLQKRIAKTIHSLEALAKSPLFMDTLIIDEIINFYRDAIKVHRTQMLAMVRSPSSSFLVRNEGGNNKLINLLIERRRQ